MRKFNMTLTANGYQHHCEVTEEQVAEITGWEHDIWLLFRDSRCFTFASGGSLEEALEFAEIEREILGQCSRQIDWSVVAKKVTHVLLDQVI